MNTVDNIKVIKMISQEELEKKIPEISALKDLGVTSSQNVLYLYLPKKKSILYYERQFGEHIEVPKFQLYETKISSSEKSIVFHNHGFAALLFMNKPLVSFESFLQNFNQFFFDNSMQPAYPALMFPEKDNNYTYTCTYAGKFIRILHIQKVNTLLITYEGMIPLLENSESTILDLLNTILNKKGLCK